MWWHASIISSLGVAEQENCELEANLAKTLSEIQSKTNNSSNNKTKLKNSIFFFIFWMQCSLC